MINEISHTTCEEIFRWWPLLERVWITVKHPNIEFLTQVPMLREL